MVFTLTVGFLLTLTSLAPAWYEPLLYRADHVELTYYSLPTRYFVVKVKRWSWLPGRDRLRREISAEEYETWRRTGLREQIPAPYLGE